MMQARMRNQTLILPDTLDTFLPPFEGPKGLMMKLAYYFTRLQFGRVLTPLKVHTARLPLAFGLSRVGLLFRTCFLTKVI